MNKKRILTIVIIVLLILVFLLFFFKVGSKRVNKSYYEVNLNAEYENGLMWTYTISKDNIVEIRNAEYKDGVQHYEFIGINKGQVDIVFSYQKEGTKDIIDTKKYTLVVDKSLNIRKR